MRSIARIAVLGLLAGSVPAMAEDSTPAKKEAKPVKERKICRATAATGSIRIKRVCKTAQEWQTSDGAELTTLSKGATLGSVSGSGN